MEKGKARSGEKHPLLVTSLWPRQSHLTQGRMLAGEPVCSTVSCSQMPWPARAPARWCRPNLPRGLTTLPLVPGTSLDCARGAPALPWAAGDRGLNSESPPRLFMVQGSQAVRPQEQTPPHGRLARAPDTAPSQVSTAETGVRPELSGGRPPARKLQGGGLCRAEMGARVGGEGHSEAGTEPKPGELRGVELTGPGSPRGAARGESCSVASELRARGRTVCTMLFLLFKETVGIICPFPKCRCPSLPSSHPQPLPGEVGEGSSPSSAEDPERRGPGRAILGPAFFLTMP